MCSDVGWIAGRRLGRRPGWRAGWRAGLVPLLLLALAVGGAGEVAAQVTSDLVIRSASVTEGDSGTTNLTFTVVISPTSLQQVTVDWAEGTGGTATSGTDYTAITGGTLTFAAGDLNKTITVAVTGDTVQEANETIVITLSNAVGARIFTGTGTGTITDDDAPALSIDSPSVTEGDSGTKDLTFTVTLSPVSTQEVTVEHLLSVGGTATLGTDYVVASRLGTLTFPPGTSTQTIVIPVIGDLLDEPNELLLITLGSPTNAPIETRSGIGRIIDNDPTPTLSIDSPSVTEGDSGTKDLTFTVRLSAPSGNPLVVVSYNDTGNGTATSGTDYTAITSYGRLEFRDGATSATIDVPLIGDELSEADETIEVALIGPNRAVISPTAGTGTGTITNDDDPPTLSIDSPSVTEGDSGSKNLAFKVTLQGMSDQDVTVDWAEGGGGTATPGTDYTEIEGGTLTFPAGRSQTTPQTINVAVRGETTPEPNETVVVSLRNPKNATIATATGTGTITDNDAATPTLSIDSPRVTEGDSGTTTMTFAMTLSEASARQVTVDYADAGTGTATSGTDYTAITGGTLTFRPGQTRRTVNVFVRGDTTVEPHETVKVALSNPTNATISATAGTGTGTITNDDGATLSIDSPSVPEGADGDTTNLTFTVTLSATSSQPVTVNWAKGTGGTATSGTDYTAITGGALTFAAGETSKTIDVSVTGDDLDEANETVVATLSGATGATLATATGTGTITDDDAPPTLSIDSPRATEGDRGSTNLTFTVTLSAASARQVTVDWVDEDTGAATPGTDYRALTGGKLTFPAGATSQTIDVAVTGDVLDEENETVVVTLSNARNATIATPTGTGTITDDDAATATLSIDSPSVTEGDSGSKTLTFTVTLSAASGRQVTVDYADAGNTGTGTATSGTDYRPITGGTLTFRAGQTRRTVNVFVRGDTLDEANETIVITLSDAANARIATATGTGTIINDDGAPTLSINSPSETEGNSGDTTTLTFTVTLSATSAQQVTVAWADAGTGTATSGVDYTATTGGTLTFPAGTTTQTFPVSVIGDATDESNETVVMTLSSATGATIATATGTGRIINDDGQPMISVDSPSVTEGDSGTTDLIFTVTLIPATNLPGGGGFCAGGRQHGHARDGLRGVPLHPGDLPAGDDHPALQRKGDGRYDRRAERDHRGDPAQPGERGDLAGRWHRHNHRRRRRAVAVNQLAKRDRGRHRREEPDVHGNLKRGERPAGDGGLRGRQDRHGHVRDRLHGHHRRHADLPGGRHQPDLQRRGDRRHRRRGERDRGGVAKQPVQCDCIEYGEYRHGNDHGQRRRALAVDRLAARDGGRRRRHDNPDVQGDLERGERPAGDGGLRGRRG